MSLFVSPPNDTDNIDHDLVFNRPCRFSVLISGHDKCSDRWNGPCMLPDEKAKAVLSAAEARLRLNRLIAAAGLDAS